MHPSTQFNARMIKINARIGFFYNPTNQRKTKRNKTNPKDSHANCYFIDIFVYKPTYFLYICNNCSWLNQNNLLLTYDTVG